MKIYDNIQQQSEEWFSIRQKKLTASHAQAIAANGKGLKTYVLELMSEYYSSAPKAHFSNHHTERGNELEKFAAMEYSLRNMAIVRNIGFVEYNDYVGCSPDRFVGDNGLIEIKSPADKAYFNYMIDRKIDSKYVAQMQMQMLICEKEWCDYVVFNPNFEQNIFVKRVYPDAKKVKALQEGFKSGQEMITEIENRMEAV